MSCFVFLPGCNPVKALCQSCKNVTHLISSHRLLQTNCFEEEVCFSVEFQNDLLFWWLINIFPLVSSHAKPHRKVVKNTIINIQVFFAVGFNFFLGTIFAGFCLFFCFPLSVPVIRLRQDYILHFPPLFCACRTLGMVFLLHFCVS